MRTSPFQGSPPMGAPTATSGVPSPSTSPAPATADPKRVQGRSIQFRRTEPSEPENTVTSGGAGKPYAGAPTTMSGTPSKSRSPHPATAQPNWLSGIPDQDRRRSPVAPE